VISGTIISDRSSLNIPDHNAFIQDNTAGINLRFDLISPFNLGDSIVIDVSGDTLMEYNGLLEINYIALAGATLAGTGTIIPQTVTVADILNNMSGTSDTWESTLVTINNATISNDSSGIYSGADTLQDGTGTMILFTRSLATFATSSLPAGQVNITGYISDFNSPELIIRSLNDVHLLSSVFENTGANTDIAIGPNPGNGQIRITSAIPIDEIKVRNTLGQITNQFHPQSNNFSLQLDEPGIYFIQITMGKETIAKKLIVCK
jgi:hypothetical protein